jgi:hypothetical protein
MKVSSCDRKNAVILKVPCLPHGQAIVSLLQRPVDECGLEEITAVNCDNITKRTGQTAS